MTDRNLLDCAIAARERAYAPYSHFAVGAALLTQDGQVYVGCNIENVSYSATVCAERVALFSAVAAGEKKFVAIAVAGGTIGEELPDQCVPCGVCRQALAEFFEPTTRIVTGNKQTLTVASFDTFFPTPFAG